MKRKEKINRMIISINSHVVQSLDNSWFCFFLRLLSDRLVDFFATEDPSCHNSGEESFSSIRERSVSEPNVFRSRITSATAPLVSV